MAFQIFFKYSKINAYATIDSDEPMAAYWVSVENIAEKVYSESPHHFKKSALEAIAMPTDELPSAYGAFLSST